MTLDAPAALSRPPFDSFRACRPREEEESRSNGNSMSNGGCG